MAASTVMEQRSAVAVPLKVQVLRRSLALNVDPWALYRALSDNGTRVGSLLLETADLAPASAQISSAKSLLYPRACLRVTGRERQVRMQALNANGEVIVRALLADSSLPQLESGQSAESAQDLALIVLAYDLPHCGDDERQRLRKNSPFTALRNLFARLRQNQTDIDSELQLVGNFAFESLRLFESLPELENAEDSDDFELYLPDQIISIPAQGPLQIRSLCFGDDTRHYHDAMLGLQALIQTVEAQSALTPTTNIAPAPSSVSNGALAAVQTDCDEAAFIARVEQAKEYLRAGEAFQIVLSRRFTLPCPDPLAAYKQLRGATLSPYLFYFVGLGAVIFGASPESAVKVDGSNRRLEILPIAGTRGRGRDENGEIEHDSDARIEAELRLDKKEIAEHMMLVDLARNDVARISKAGTRRISELLTIRRYARVMHLVSRVEGELQDDLDALHALAATMPMGTLSGAPKLRAIEIIRELEGRSRGSYGGAIGYINAAGTMDTAIVIRSAIVSNGVAQIQAGAGVVLHSDPMAEAQETLRKAEVVIRAIVAAGVENNDQ